MVALVINAFCEANYIDDSYVRGLLKYFSSPRPEVVLTAADTDSFGWEIVENVMMLSA